MKLSPHLFFPAWLVIGGIPCGPAATQASAAVIANFPSQTSLSSFGEPFAPYNVQTFRALAPGMASRLTIELSHDHGEDNTEFHVLLTEVTGYGQDFHPTKILYESPRQTLEWGSPVTRMDISLPNIPLQAGSRYAIVLDAFVTRDGLSGAARIGTNGSYAEGEFYFNHAFAGDTREDHFADSWFFTESIYPPDIHDLAFELEFIPEPSTFLLALCGTFMVWRRRRSAMAV